MHERIPEIEGKLKGEVELGVTIPLQFDCNKPWRLPRPGSLHEEISKALRVLEEGVP